MSNLGEELAVLDGELKYAEALSLYKNINSTIDQIARLNQQKSVSDESQHRQQVATQMARLAGLLSNLKSVVSEHAKIDPSQHEEGELCLTDVIARLHALAAAWQGKHWYLCSEGNVYDWLTRFTGTAKDALKTAWDRANGKKPM